jgi:hypothetical protein
MSQVTRDIIDEGRFGKLGVAGSNYGIQPVSCALSRTGKSILQLSIIPPFDGSCIRQDLCDHVSLSTLRHKYAAGSGVGAASCSPVSGLDLSALFGSDESDPYKKAGYVIAAHST